MTFDKDTHSQSHQIIVLPINSSKGILTCLCKDFHPWLSGSLGIPFKEIETWRINIQITL